MNIMPRLWSGDGKALILEEIGAGINFDISAISMEGDRAKKPLLHLKHNELDPQISPDGRWMAYSCNESGQYEIYVRPYPEVNGGASGRSQPAVESGPYGRRMARSYFI